MIGYPKNYVEKQLWMSYSPMPNLCGECLTYVFLILYSSFEPVRRSIYRWVKVRQRSLSMSH